MINEIDEKISEIQRKADIKINKLKEIKKEQCPHKNLFRNSFFVSTTAHEWDKCRDCGKHFNEIDFPA